MGLGARRLRLERLPRPGRGRRRVARDGREAAAAAPARRAEARDHLRPQRHPARGERRGAERQRRRRRDAPRRRRQGRAGGGAAATPPRASAQALALDANELYAKLEPRHRFVWIKRRITATRPSAVRDLGDPKKQRDPIHGLTIEGEGHRYYPGRELAGPVLGLRRARRPGQGRPRARARRGAARPRRGGAAGCATGAGGSSSRGGQRRAGARRATTSTLTLDEGIQHVAERELDAALRTYETKGGIDRRRRPEHGRDPRARQRSRATTRTTTASRDADARRDRAVTDRFEPGLGDEAVHDRGGPRRGDAQADRRRSTASTASTRSAASPSTTRTSTTGSRPRRSSRGARTSARSRSASSSASRRSTRRFRRFGFGEPTGIPLPGEAEGVLRPKGRPWFDVETASASFGQGISVTTLQLAMAMSAIANGGRLLEPVLVKRVSDGAATTVREGGAARAARGRPAGRRADGRRDAHGGHRGRRHRGRGGGPGLPRRRQDGRRRRRSTRRRASTRRTSTRRLRRASSRPSGRASSSPSCSTSR